MNVIQWNGKPIGEPGIYAGVPLTRYHSADICDGPSTSSSGLQAFGDALMAAKTIHAAGLFGGTGRRKTWCGRLVGDDHLPIVGTRRVANCRACALTRQAHEHARRWGYSYGARWRAVLASSGAP